MQIAMPSIRASWLNFVLRVESDWMHVYWTNRRELLVKQPEPLPES